MEKITLGDCYHSGLAYTLGYDANGKIELDTQIFTNLDNSAEGSAMTALMSHRKQFNPISDVERFIVELRPVKIILGKEDDEDYKLSENAGCDVCGVQDRMDDNNLCEDCLEEDVCEDCYERFDDCDCDDELCEEFVADTFKPMNAFDRARWLSSLEKK